MITLHLTRGKDLEGIYIKASGSPGEDRGGDSSA